MNNSILVEKSENFAIRIIRMCQFLAANRKEFALSHQVKTSGTSIGMSVMEAICASSKEEFDAKLTEALKKARETAYWLRLLHKTSYLTDAEYKSICADCEELIQLLSDTLNGREIECEDTAWL